MSSKRFSIVILGVMAVVFSLAGGGVAFPGAGLAQYDSTTLAVRFIKPTPDEYSFIPVCNNFVVKVNIKNTGDYPTEQLGAEIILPQQGPPAPGLPIGGQGGAHLLPGQDPQQQGPDVPPGGSWQPSWKLHCDGVGPVTIVVRVYAMNIPYDQWAFRTIIQGKPHLEVTITAPPDGAIYYPCTTFDVTATVKNTGKLPAYGATLTAEIGSPTAKFVEGETETKDVGGECKYMKPIDGGQNNFTGAYPVPEFKVLKTCIAPGKSYEVSWKVHCEGPGDAVITVKPDGWMYMPLFYDAVPTGDGFAEGLSVNNEIGYKPIRIYDANLEADSITVRQIERPGQEPAGPRAQLCADIPGCPHCFMTPFVVKPKKAAAGQPVTFTANVLNGGDVPGNYEVALKVNGKVEQTRTVTVAPQTASPVSFTIVKSEPGTYTVDIGGRRDSFIVEGSSSTAGASGSNVVIPIIAVSLLIIIGVVLVLLVRRRPA